MRGIALGVPIEPPVIEDEQAAGDHNYVIFNGFQIPDYWHQQTPVVFSPPDHMTTYWSPQYTTNTTTIAPGSYTVDAYGQMTYETTGQRVTFGPITETITGVWEP